jgi:hypothetical protein
MTELEVQNNHQITPTSLECPFVPKYDVELNPLTEEDVDSDFVAEVQSKVQTEVVPVSRPPLVVDHDLENKVRRACERISENVHICANEPSLAFFRLSEHVRKALPPTVENRQQVQHIQRQLGSAYEDAELALQEVQSMEQASPSLLSTMELLRNAIQIQQQIKQEQSKRPIKKEPSMYQRLSAHLNSVELLSELRDSANRISSSSAGSTSTNDAESSVTIPTKMTRSESITKYQ